MAARRSLHAIDANGARATPPDGVWAGSQRRQLMAEVNTYRDAWRGEFERLNREWIETWFVLEEADLATFRDPVAKIIRPGGQIFFVVEGDKVLGTCAVVRHRPEVH